MKKYKIKEDILVWQWTGDLSIVDEINDSLKEYNNTYKDKLKVLVDDDVLGLNWKVGVGTTNEFVRIGDYIIFNINDYERPLGCYSEEWLNKKYVEV